MQDGTYLFLWFTCYLNQLKQMHWFYFLSFLQQFFKTHHLVLNVGTVTSELILIFSFLVLQESRTVFSDFLYFIVLLYSLLGCALTHYFVIITMIMDRIIHFKNTYTYPHGFFACFHKELYYKLFYLFTFEKFKNTLYHHFDVETGSFSKFDIWSCCVCRSRVSFRVNVLDGKKKGIVVKVLYCLDIKHKFNNDKIVKI